MKAWAEILDKACEENRSVYIDTTQQLIQVSSERAVNPSPNPLCKGLFKPTERFRRCIMEMGYSGKRMIENRFIGQFRRQHLTINFNPYLSDQVVTITPASTGAMSLSTEPV